MSTGLELIPLALAIGAAAAAVRTKPSKETPSVLALPTRMRDQDLLARTLETVGAYYGVRDGVLYGSIAQTAVAFALDAAGVYEAHFAAAVPLEDAQRLLVQADEDYARLVQRQVYERLLARAPSSGLVLESEHVEEGDIVLTLRVEEGA